MTLGPSYFGDDDYDDERSPSEYCKHGNYIGNWAGPDYLCGACEDGLSDSEWAEICKAQEAHREREMGERMFFHALGAMSKMEHASIDPDGTWAVFILWLFETRNSEVSA